MGIDTILPFNSVMRRAASFGPTPDAFKNGVLSHLIEYNGK